MRARLGRWLSTVLPGRRIGVLVLISAVVVAAVTFVVLELHPSRTPAPRPIVVSSGSWAPFVGPDLPRGGPIAELVTEVLRRQGYAPEISFTSWPLAERQAASGATVGVFPLVGSESRRRDLLVSGPLVDFQYVLFFSRLRGQPVVTGPADLAGLRIGRIAGYDYWPELEAAVPSFVEYDSSLAAFQALAAGEIDLLPEGLLPGQALLDSPQFGFDSSAFGHVQGGEPMLQSTQALHFMLPPSEEGHILMRAFDEGLAELRAAPLYAQVVGDLRPDASTATVNLAPEGTTGFVELLDADGTLALLAPRGTRARVLDWPQVFVTGPADASASVLARVKILNGPARGRVLHVDARALVLPDAD
jgi:ABC-type amino acid transport substrate-binding protein